MTDQVNDNLVLISGGSTTGKSASLMNLRDQEGVLYLGCEAGKKLPFRNKFATFNIDDPYQILEACDALIENNGVLEHPQLGKDVQIHTLVVDTVTFMMDMFESVHVIPSPNTMQAWGNYGQFFKTLMQDRVVKLGRIPINVLMLAHTLTTLNENEGKFETKVPVKGSLKNQGIEAYFSCVVSTKRVPIKKLEGYDSPNLVITDEERALGFKYVYQCKHTKDTIDERIRSPIGMFTTAETFMDNDAQKLIDHLHRYYNEE